MRQIFHSSYNDLMLTERKNWFDLNPWKARLLVLILSIGFLELVTRLAVIANMLPYQPYPTSETPQLKDYVHPIVGMWRYPNASEYVHESCFDITYRSNSIGALDQERSLRSGDERRVIVLGDSFAEGFGVEPVDRFSNILESQTGDEHLNFAMGGTGTVHQWLTYESIAAAFDHSEVHVYVLPYNDFLNNNPPDSLKAAYIPLLRETNDGFEIYYPMDFKDRPREIRSTKTRIKNGIDNRIYIANVLRWSARLIKNWFRGPHRSERDVQGPNYYDSYSKLDWKIFAYSLKQISELAGEREVYVFTIPYFKDFEFAQENGYRFALVDRLSELSERLENIQYVDLLPTFLRDAGRNRRDFADYLLPCDLHFNQIGNEIIAAAVKEALSVQ